MGLAVAFSHTVVGTGEGCDDRVAAGQGGRLEAPGFERYGFSMGRDLKSGGGPQPVLDWLEAVAEALAIEDQGDLVDTIQLSRIGELRASAAPHLTPGGHP